MILIPMKWVAAKKNVITKELVAVKEYGIKPARFDNKIKVNKKNNIEKYWERFKFVLLFKIPFIRSYTDVTKRSQILY
jgi:hypothetical protein